MGTEDIRAERDIPSSTLAALRGILVSSLSRENLASDDVLTATRRRKVTFLDGLVDAGAAPVDTSQRPQGSACRDVDALGPSTPAEDTAAGAEDAWPQATGRDNGGVSQREREERLRALKERQHEERQRKLEELKQQALAAQKFREHKEEERRRRLDELRQRDTERRHQVEERKRQIWEAERDRREAILRKNQEREARIDSKRKNERSSIVFAFGSSTPRMLEPADTGGSFWGTRRATSTTNVMTFTAAAPLTRRASERELDGGSKKRATSASGLDRKPGEDMTMSTSMYEVFHWDSASSEPLAKSKVLAKSSSDLGEIPGAKTPTPATKPQVPNELTLTVDGRAPHVSSARVPHTPSPRTVHIASILGGSPGGEETDVPAATAAYSTTNRVNRRKTDLMPTIPSPRDLTPTSAGSRPPSAHTQQQPPPQQQSRPFSRSPGLRSGEATPTPPSRPMSALSQQSTSSISSGVNLRPRPLSAPRRQRPVSIAVTGVSQEPPESQHAVRTTHRHSIAGDVKAAKAQGSNAEKDGAKPPLPKTHSAKKTSKPETPAKKPTDKILKSAKASPRVTPKATPLQSPGSEATPTLPQDVPEPSLEVKEEGKEEVGKMTVTDADEYVVEVLDKGEEATKAFIQEEQARALPPMADMESEKEEPQLTQKTEVAEQSEPEVDMTASMIAKIRITTEEEAKAALAERRRLAREQAEREAELERQRQEEERRCEEERLRQEEEEQRRFEEEQLRLVEEARRAEEDRLLQAIQENERREEEERKRREEEARIKAEKEESERKAREEAERLRREMDERLKKEEEERIARRKRVEAIMLRTRGKGATPTGTPTKSQQDGEGDTDESPSDETKSAPGGGNGECTMRPQGEMSASGEDDGTAAQQTSQPHENGQEKTSSLRSNSDLLLIDTGNVKPMEMEISEDMTVSSTTTTTTTTTTIDVSQSNGHRNGMEYSPVDFVNVDNVKEYNNTTNTLLDLSEFDAFSPTNVLRETGDAFELTTGKLANEDNVNSNVTSNGPAAPLIAFQDSLGKKQDPSVADLLS